MTHMVAWNQVTRDDVIRAIGEYDQLGPEAFFAQHGFGYTTTYDLLWEKRRYPPKAILGTAYEIATGQRLASGDFEGGRSGAVRVLGQLGFTVKPKAAGQLTAAFDPLRRARAVLAAKASVGDLLRAIRVRAARKGLTQLIRGPLGGRNHPSRHRQSGLSLMPSASGIGLCGSMPGWRPAVLLSSDSVLLCNCEEHYGLRSRRGLSQRPGRRRAA
jgi:hypothetical protein